MPVFFHLLLDTLSPSITEFDNTSCNFPSDFEPEAQFAAGTAKIGTTHLVPTSSTLSTRGLLAPMFTTNTTRLEIVVTQGRVEIMKRPNAAAKTIGTIFTFRESLHQKATRCWYTKRENGRIGRAGTRITLNLEKDQSITHDLSLTYSGSH
jgi:hypothetical protein